MTSVGAWSTIVRSSIATLPFRSMATTGRMRSRRKGSSSLSVSETDFANDLREIDIPVLLLHGDVDQIVPIDDSAKKSVKLLKRGTLKVIPGGAHGMATTMADRINQELLEFAKA